VAQISVNGGGGAAAATARDRRKIFYCFFSRFMTFYR
jgi:hypothetical protein